MKKDPKVASQVARTSISVTPTALSLPSDQEAGVTFIFTLHTKAGVDVSAGVVIDLVRVGRALTGYTIQYSPEAAQRFPALMLVASVQRLRVAMQAAG